MFMDEARFGRISDTRRCWCPKPIRPVCYAMVSQEYTYAYAAVSVSDGTMDSLILPHVNGDCMQIFIDEVAARHLDDRIIMALDGAGWHRNESLMIPDNLGCSAFRHILQRSTLSSISGTICGKRNFITEFLTVLIPSRITWKKHCTILRMIRIVSVQS